MIRVSFSLFLSISVFCYFTLLLIFIKIILLLLLFYLFIFMKIIVIFSCSGMFRHFPECSMFLVLSTPVVVRLCQGVRDASNVLSWPMANRFSNYQWDDQIDDYDTLLSSSHSFFEGHLNCDKITVLFFYLFFYFFYFLVLNIKDSCMISILSCGTINDVMITEQVVKTVKVLQ